MTGSQPNALARTLRQFFADHLPGVRGVSRHTIDSYRYALILLLRFLATSHGRSVAALDLVDIEAEDVITFLEHLEHARHNTVATRNVRWRPSMPFFNILPPASRSNWRARNGSFRSPSNGPNKGIWTIWKMPRSQ